MASVKHMNARDHLARDVLTELTRKGRGRLATVSLKTIPDNMAYVDWMKAVSDLSQAGIVDLHNDNVEDVASKVSSSINQSIMTPTEAEMKARDRLLRDVMAETPEEDRGRLLTVAIYSMPSTMAFIDWIIVVSMLSRVYDDDDYENLVLRKGWSYEVDDDGRIIELSISAYGVDPFDLPTGIARLERLTILTVYNCRSLPAKELSSLLYLQELRFGRCSYLLENFPLQLKLINLKKLHVSESKLRPSSPFRFQSSSPFLTWMTKQLPSLETLTFLWMGKNQITSILDALRNLDLCFQDSLKAFRMKSCKLNDNQLETLLFEIISRFPNMNRLDLLDNEIQSVRSIVDRLKSDKTCFVSKSIRFLNLGDNPIMNKIKIKSNELRWFDRVDQYKVKADPKEKAAILSFLQTFNTIFKLGGYEADPYDLDVEHALRINHAGRPKEVMGALGKDSKEFDAYSKQFTNQVSISDIEKQEVVKSSSDDGGESVTYRDCSSSSSPQDEEKEIAISYSPLPKKDKLAINNTGIFRMKVSLAKYMHAKICVVVN